ncbi:Ovate protein family [Cocos nucifera]|uniref:Transcription repressor n=1 Tax=Cocos nucifera TaxID=13894 RepID=A0A8K0N745_COCNU|nr:Ovate protein family [Cocos nucifera]KAG1360931.1 Ovate protein family [Cocos nucifera]
MGGEGMRRRKKRNERYLSFSARLPDDVKGVFAQSVCMVKLSSDPYDDFKKSIMEMVRTVGIRSWEEMEELVYCFVVLNSPDVHGVIMDAFLSVCSYHQSYLD